jgi:hypothetical protein
MAEVDPFGGRERLGDELSNKMIVVGAQSRFD